MTRNYRIAVIPGDGIGKEVMPEALRALDVISKRYGLGVDASTRVTRPA